MTEQAKSSPDSGGTAVQAPPQTRPAKPQRKRLPPYKLVLHNDPVNTMDIVVLAIVTLTPLNPAQAEQKMWEAHRSGQSVLLVTHRERGELYVQQFASQKITTSLEPDA